ncbi:FtsX-like permease family protein [Streptomyces sp. NBC_01544]|uniref:FtsX-like permease family protein n=1 Tax=unclassified Streptomyces TaxID=2593676 RepID=UPI0028C3AFB5|nr:FtsX-like permease family protein [Streptomyces sp. AM2-3-1]WNO67541.1 FtsX-like permease family protein [Streptomyces sp. AM2-3-1]WTI89937.1 FtsX-like permease family protein [Streptomyces sp. NBC_00724]
MMLRYALRTIRDRKSGFLGALLALMCAAALITACGTLLETGLRGRIATERYAGAPLVVSADQNVHRTTVKHKSNGETKAKHKAKPVVERAWLPAATADRIRPLEGVRKVIPELTFLAEPVTEPVTEPVDRPSYGHSWASASITPFTLTTGRAPATADDIVIDRGFAERVGLKPGDRLTVQSTGTPRPYRISGIAAPAGRGELQQQTSLFFLAAEAERLAARPGQVTALGVLPAPGTDPTELKRRVERALKGTTAQVATGDDRGPVEFLDAAGARTKLVSMGGAMGGTSLLVAILVVVGTFALSIQQRHRELALLRAIAATSRQIRRLLGREALIVGAVAGVLGSLAGLPLATWLHSRFIDMGAIPANLERTAGIFPAFAAVAVTLLGAWAAARISGRRIARIRPAEAMAESAVERDRPARGRIAAGLVLLAGGGVLVAVLSGLHVEAASTPVTFLAVVVLATAVSLLGPLLIRMASALLAGPLRLAGFGGTLATANIRGNSTRMAAVVTPLTLLIGMTCTVLFVQPTLGSAARNQAREGTRATWVLATQGPGIPSVAAETVRTTEGVTAATEVVRTTVRVGLDKYQAQGVTQAGLSRTWDPEVTGGSLADFAADPGTAAVSELAAERLGLHPGSTLKLHLGDGTPATLTVAAVYARGLGFGDLTLPHDLVARHMDNPLAATVLVAGDSDRGRLAAALKKFPGIAVLAPATADRLQADRQQENAEVNYLAMGLILAFTAIAVVNTLAMSVSERIKEFAMLRLAGATRRQVLRMLRIEALSILLIAAVLGTGIALAVLTAFSIGMTGSAAPTVMPVVYATVVGAAALLVLVASALPGRVALKARPVEVAASQR